jgi:capsular polysaccharide biosynthesis protein
MEFVDLHDLARQNHPGIFYREAAPEDAGFRPPPRFFFGPIPKEFGEWHFGDRLAPKVGLFDLTNITLTGDRVLVWEDKILCLGQNGLHGGVTDGLERQHKILEIEETVVLLCGPAYQMYGHWLVDFLPRLHVLTALGYDICSLRYLLPHNLIDFSYQWLSLLGISKDQIISYDVVTEQCRIRHALIPTGLRGNSRASPLLRSAMQDFKGRLQQNPAAPATRRLYISRRAWPNFSRNLSNVEAVETVFEKHGFEMIAPEKLTIKQQVQLFSESLILAGEYGSALHNSIFAPRQATVMALRGTEGHPGFLQSGLCEALGQTYGYVFGKTEAMNGGQEYSIELDQLELCIKLILASD